MWRRRWDSNPRTGLTVQRFRVVDGGDSTGSFRVTGVPPGKPENPLLMRVSSSKRASEQGFPGVGIIAPQQSVSLVKSLVKMQSAADGRFFLSIPEVICYTEIRPAKGVRR